MKTASLACIALLSFALSTLAWAYDECDTVASNPVALGENLRENALARVPVKYYEVARSIDLIVKPPNEAQIIPFATEQQGRRIVILPAQFAVVACKLAIAEYLDTKATQKVFFDQAVGDAAKCFDSGGSQRTCLTAFANELEGQYRKAFGALSPQEQHTVFGIYYATLHQVVMHEYGHHLLNHLNRVRAQQLPRIDAEFEADLFAILNGVQAGEPASAMYYFFGPMAAVESRTSKLATKDYESSSCRAGNVDNITAFTGIAPIVMVDAAYGGGYTLQHNSPAAYRTVAEKEFSGARPAVKPGSCGRIANVALPDLFTELRRVCMRMGEDVDLLFATQGQPNVARMTRLISDLSAMSASFRYMDGVTAKSISLILRRWELAGHNLTPLLGPQDRLINTPSVTGNFQCDDFGRLLQTEGIAVLQERTDLALQPRLDQSFALLSRAAVYNPAQAETWMNLAFIAFKRGDCKTASGFAEKASATLTEKKDAEGTQAFASAMKKWSQDPKACAAESVKFHPYKNL